MRWALITSICLFSIYNGMDPRVLAGQRLAYAMTFLFAALAATATLHGRKLRGKDAKSVALLVALFLAFLLPTLTQAVVYPHYVAGDLASLLMPILFWVAMRGYPSLLRASSFGALIAAGAVAAMLAPSFADAGGRYEAPSPFVIGSLWFGVFYARGRTSLLIQVVLVPLVLWLAFASGFRSSALLVPIGAMVAVVLRRRTLRTAVVLAIGVLAAMPFVWNFAEATLWSTLRESRFRPFLFGEVDESMLTRFLESADALSTVRSEWGPVNYLLGSGHGATYLPNLSLEARNLTAEGRIHNIHITPALILFRYGLLGAGVMIYGLVRLAVGFQTVRNTPSSSQLASAYAIIVVLYVADSSMRNNLVDPGFSFALAALFTLASAAHKSKAARVEQAGRRRSRSLAYRRRIGLPPPKVCRESPLQVQFDHLGSASHT